MGCVPGSLAVGSFVGPSGSLSGDLRAFGPSPWLSPVPGCWRPAPLRPWVPGPWARAGPVCPWPPPCPPRGLVFSASPWSSGVLAVGLSRALGSWALGTVGVGLAMSPVPGGPRPAPLSTAPSCAALPSRAPGVFLRPTQDPPPSPTPAGPAGAPRLLPSLEVVRSHLAVTVLLLRGGCLCHW